MAAATTCSSTTAYGRQYTGRRSLRRSGAALGSTKEIRTVGLFLILRNSVTSWRLVTIWLEPIWIKSSASNFRSFTVNNLGVFLLQAEYKKAVSTNQWHRRLEFPSGETIVMHNPKVNVVLKWGDGVAMMNGVFWSEVCSVVSVGDCAVSALLCARRVGHHSGRTDQAQSGEERDWRWPRWNTGWWVHWFRGKAPKKTPIFYTVFVIQWVYWERFLFFNYRW